MAKSKRRRVSGGLLRAARVSAGLSQEDLAKKLDVRVPTISERENAARGVTWETWVSWAWACEVGVDWQEPERSDDGDTSAP